MERRATPLVAGLCLLVALLAGCSSSPGEPAPGEGPIVVTDPKDFSDLNRTDAASRPHVHDYWGGQRTMPLMDVAWQGQLQTGQPGGYTAVLRDFQPGDGAIVPQGAGNLTVTATITPGTGDMFSDPVLLWSGPADGGFNASARALPIDGQPVRIALGPQDADLPHQSLSGWAFRATVKATPTGLRFTGTLTIHAEAERGDGPLPVFPGHADEWNGEWTLPLLAVDGTVRDVYVSNLESCATLATPKCPDRIRLADGKVVPYDATYVEARLDSDLVSTGLQLYYHGADTRGFKPIQPDRSEGSVQVYDIALASDGDSPYAQQSLWEFLVTGPSPGGERLVEAGSYNLTASAHR